MSEEEKRMNRSLLENIKKDKVLMKKLRGEMSGGTALVGIQEGGRSICAKPKDSYIF
jgi:hypothetical protein